MSAIGFCTDIPVVDVREGGTIALADQLQGEYRGLRDSMYGSLPPALNLVGPVVEHASSFWLKRTRSPYSAEIAHIARHLDVHGAYTMNSSLLWACTANAGGSGQRLMRVLDWPFAGLGGTIVIARQRGAAGEFFNVTWPGTVGVATAIAPGRFAAAINIAPLRRRTWGKHLKHLDRAINAVVTLSSVRLPPPDHMLRHVFENAVTYDEAVSMIARAEIARPGLFSLVGPEAGQSCVVEHKGRSARVIDGPVTVTNDWQTPEPRWDPPEPADDILRRQTLDIASTRSSAPFDWLVPPVLNSWTRMAVEMDAANGTLYVRGYERDPDDFDGPSLIVASSGLLDLCAPGEAIAA